MMRIQFATKRVDGQYEAALIVDNKFSRSGSGKSITDLFVKLAGPVLAAVQEEGTEIAVDVGIMTPVEAARQLAREQRAQATREAEEEAKEIEALTAAVEREKKAREAGTEAAK
jgi:hypothetical protein